MFDLPLDWQTFYLQMIHRAKIYIENSYWDIEEDQLQRWLNNFVSDHEKFLAALIIYRLIYRNPKTRISMFKHIIQVLLPTILEKNNLCSVEPLDVFLDQIERAPSDLPFRFSAVYDVNGKISKSGPTILREFRRDGFFHQSLEISINEDLLKDKKIKAIVFFDDFMGTGNQFKNFIEKIDIYIKDLTIIYCPLVAHAQGVKNISVLYPKIIVSPVEVLDDSYDFFNAAYMPKLVVDSIDTEQLKQVYIQLLKKTKLDKKVYFGYGNQALTYIFNLSSPNNSLPILTYHDSDIGWERLFSR